MLSMIIPTLNDEEGVAKAVCSISEETREKSETIAADVSTNCTPVIS